MSNSEFFTVGNQLRDLLLGLLQSGGGGVRAEWGPRVDHTQLQDLYAPTKIKKHSATPGGIDNLALSSVDTFEIPGQGAFEVKFEGYFKVAREQTKTQSWADYAPAVNMIDIRLRGEAKGLGPIEVNINPDMVSAGQVFASGGATAAAKCRIATAVTFTLPQMNMTLFNKEPILLMNDAIDSVPPVEDPNGKAHIYRVPLYNRADPNGRPVAYLTSLRYTVGNYLTRDQVATITRGGTPK